MVRFPLQLSIKHRAFVKLNQPDFPVWRRERLIPTINPEIDELNIRVELLLQ